MFVRRDAQNSSYIAFFKSKDSPAFCPLLGSKYNWPEKIAQGRHKKIPEIRSYSPYSFHYENRNPPKPMAEESTI